jgi:WhiB family redox-sensing transcriptional regulator
MIDDSPTDWRLDAACLGNWKPFHAPHYERGPAVHRRVQEAKAICATCPVRTPCLELALDTYDRHGIYGGTTARERRALAKTRNGAAA